MVFTSTWASMSVCHLRTSDRSLSVVKSMPCVYQNLFKWLETSIIQRCTHPTLRHAQGLLTGCRAASLAHPEVGQAVLALHILHAKPDLPVCIGLILQAKQRFLEYTSLPKLTEEKSAHYTSGLLQ